MHCGFKGNTFSAPYKAIHLIPATKAVYGTAALLQEIVEFVVTLTWFDPLFLSTYTQWLIVTKNHVLIQQQQKKRFIKLRLK